MVAALAVPAGLIFGSFATVVAHRVPRRESFVAGRSRCPHCGSTIAAYDNIPVVSWLLLRGRCRNCREAIPARYPLTELTMAALFVATAAKAEPAGGDAAFTMAAERAVAAIEREDGFSGVILIAMGVLLFTNELTTLNAEALRAMDNLNLNFFSEL